MTPLTSLVRVWLGTTLLVRGDAARAERAIEKGLRSARARGDALCTYVALYNLAQLAFARDDLPLAAGALEEGVELSGHTRDRANLAHFLEALSAVASLRGEEESAAVLIGASEGSLREVGAPVYNFYVRDSSLREHASARARTELGEAAFEEARERGWAMTFEQAVAYALSVARAPKPGP